MGRFKSLLFMLIFLSLSRSCMSWSWFSSSSSSKTTGQNPPETLQISGDASTVLSMDAFNDEKAIQRIKDAKAKLTSCWCNAYQGLFKACSEIASEDNDKKKRFSWELSNCFQKDTGRPPFPMCREGSPMKDCLAKLDDNAIQTYRAFYLETNSICHQLQLSLISLLLLIFSFGICIDFKPTYKSFLSSLNLNCDYFFLLQVSCIQA